MTISVDTTQPEVYKLKGRVITSIIKGTLVKAFYCNKIKSIGGWRNVLWGISFLITFMII